MPIIRSSRVCRRLQHVAHDTSCRLAVGLVWGCWQHSQQEGFTECRCQRHVKPPNLEENQGFRGVQLSPQEAPSVWSDASEPSSGMWNYGREMAEKFCRKLETSTSLLGSFTCRKARHGTDGFTLPPKEGVLRIFRPKVPTASAGFKPSNLGTKGQHATSRPPKPLAITYYLNVLSQVSDTKKNSLSILNKVLTFLLC
jgi:hypothetical protein